MAGCGGCRHGRLWRLQADQAVAAAGRPGCGSCRHGRLWRLQAWQAVAAAGMAGCGSRRHAGMVAVAAAGVAKWQLQWSLWR